MRLRKSVRGLDTVCSMFGYYICSGMIIFEYVNKQAQLRLASSTTFTALIDMLALIQWSV